MKILRQLKIEYKNIPITGIMVIVGVIVASSFIAYRSLSLKRSTLPSESTQPVTSVEHQTLSQSEQTSDGEGKVDVENSTSLGEKKTKCLGADRKYSFVTQELCESTKKYWTRILGFFPSDPEEIIQCQGADGKYANVPRKICESTNAFWSANPPPGGNSSSQSNNSTSSETSIPFVGALDSYGNLYAVHAAKRVLTSYTGPLYTIRRFSDNTTLDVLPAANGWPDKNEVQAWLNGSNAFITTVYDQTGNGRHLTQATTTKQPSLNLSGTQAVFEFDGLNQEFSGTSSLSAFAKNSGAASIIAVRRNNLATTADRQVVFVSTATSTNPRMWMGPTLSLGTDAASGRRLDTDTTSFTNGFSLNTNWATQIGRWDWSSATLYHQNETQNETKTSFQTSGLTSDTVSAAVSVGGKGTATSLFNGDLSLIAWIQVKIPDTQVASMTSSLANLQINDAPNQFLSWGNTALTGPYSFAPSLTNFTVLSPDGSTPTEGALESHRYRHHTQITTHNGRVWVAFSSVGTNEGASGQMVVAASSADNGSSWSAPTLVVPSQSTFNATGASCVDGSRITYPSSFTKYNGDLYLISEIDNISNAGTCVNESAAWVAAKCNDDGTIGPLFRISTYPYSPQSGFSAIEYDETRGPSLFASSKIYCNFCELPGGSGSSLLLYPKQSGTLYVEPTTINLNASGTSLLRLWRRGITPATSLWAQRSTDAGSTWTALNATDIPNSPSEAAGIRLSDGRIALVGNPRNASVNRDPLYLAIFNASTGLIENIFAVRQGLSGNPVYPGTSKSGGAQYPGITYDGTNLWVSYSIAKESIGVTKIPLLGF